MENKVSVLMQKYELGRLLGQGTFAKVYYARNLKSGEGVAIKVIDKEKILKTGLIEQIKREISGMKSVRHPNIVQLYEVMATKNKIYFVMEYVKGGDLFNKVVKGKLKESVARKYFQQLISAIDFCHSRGVYHRDLKLENIMLDDNGNIKVSDFGLSALTESKHQDGLLHTTCGTPTYVAPEVISRKGYEGSTADVWSCGVILFVMMAGHLPFHDSNLMEMYKKISKGDFKCPKSFPREVRKLLLRILDTNPNSRISISRIMENSWFKKGFSNSSMEVKTELDNSESTPLDTDVVFGSSDSGITIPEPEPKKEAKPTNWNAFDIISLSAGLDLSGLFDETHNKREERFTSLQPASTIISKLEDIAKNLKLTVRKKVGGLLKLEGENVGRKGALSIEAEIFEVTPFFHLVEVKKSSGDTLEYRDILKQEIRPALKDIVWAWEGAQQLQQEEQTPLMLVECQNPTMVY